jgi:hypothetical protein
MRAAVVAVLLTVTFAATLAGCGHPDPATAPATTPATSPTTGVQDIEDVVNDLESVVGSAESEVATN